MKILIKSKTLLNEPGYRGSQLSLPASQSKIEDAMDVARIPHNSREYLILPVGNDTPRFLRNCLQDCEPSIGEVNLLAERLEELSPSQVMCFENVVVIRNSYGIKDLINARYNLDCHMLNDVHNDEQLGYFYARNDFVPELSNLPEHLFECIDYGKLGKMMRMDENGIHTPDGYMVPLLDDWQEHYDGVNLLEQSYNEHTILDLRLVRADTDPYDERAGTWLKLPTSMAEMQTAAKALGLKSLDNCIIAEVKSCVLAFEYQLSNCEDIERLNAFAEQLFMRRDELPKFKAALEYKDCADVDTAIDIARNLDQYDFSPQTVSLEQHYRQELADAGFDFAFAKKHGYSVEVHSDRQIENGALTAYGLIRKKQEQELSMEPVDEPELQRRFEQRMGI